jgi:hypothetical protein
MPPEIMRKMAAASFAELVRMAGQLNLSSFVNPFVGKPKPQAIVRRSTNSAITRSAEPCGGIAG